MRFVVLDLETFFTNEKDSRGVEYRLKRANENACTTEEYIRHPWFKAHCAGVKWAPHAPAKWYDERQLRYVLAQEDWSDVCLICHHAHFDGFILAHHYGVRPKMYACTMAMARVLYPSHESVSLDNVRKLNGLSPKTTPYNLFKGRHWHELSDDVQRQIGEGAADECESIWKLFSAFIKRIPIEEMEVIDSVVRMFVDPVLRADTGLLAKIWEKEEHEKRNRLHDLDIDGAALRSADRFADLLRAQGIEPETKEGPPRKDGTRGTIFAFARGDPFMEELLDHEDPIVRALAEARLGEKSNIMQTRAETLGFMASRGPLCVYLRYCGAATTRVAGGDGANWLNFKRSSDLRRAILAPEGYLLGPIDASQIEFRVAMELAGQQDVIDRLKRGEDPYLPLACDFYGEEIYRPAKDDPRKLEMEQKRGCSKQANLMCIYGAAAERFKHTARVGLYGPPVDMSLEDADRFVRAFRDSHPALTARNTGYWAQCERIIARLAGGPPMEWGPFLVKHHRLILPNGLAMIYDTLEFHRPDADEDCRDFERDGYWRWRGRRGWKKIWGSKLTQNICEMVSRVIVSQAMIRIKQKYGIRTLNWPYDELLLLIPHNSKAEETLELCRLEMCAEPSWLPGIPLDAEASLGERYSK